MVVDRASAEDPGMAAAVARARFVYLAGGSPLHLRAALKKSAVFDALRASLVSGWLSPATQAGPVRWTVAVTAIDAADARRAEGSARRIARAR